MALTKNTSFGILKEDDKDEHNDSDIFEREDESNIISEEVDHDGFDKTINTKDGSTT